METKERLERAGWYYLLTYGLGIEVLARGRDRVLFDTKNDKVDCIYTIDRPIIQTKIVTDLDLDLLCEK